MYKPFNFFVENKAPLTVKSYRLWQSVNLFSKHSKFCSFTYNLNFYTSTCGIIYILFYVYKKIYLDKDYYYDY